MKELVVATRSSHKLREIADMLSDLSGIALIDLLQAGLPESPEEEGVEAFETFEENALAKARYFADKLHRPVLADDSGLCVDALGGAPGVFSKRYSGRSDLTGSALDEANNERLIHDLAGVIETGRGASYVCVLALVSPEFGEQLFEGTASGRILPSPRGDGGFGYDPLFFVPALNATFAEIPAAEKNRVSHRARALEQARSAILRLAERSPSHAPE